MRTPATVIADIGRTLQIAGLLTFARDAAWKETGHAARPQRECLHRICRDMKAVAKALSCESAELRPIEQPCAAC